MKETDAQTYFPDLPKVFTIRELKRNFRGQSFNAHPDYGGSAEKFDALKAAFEIMKCKATRPSARNAKTLKTAEGCPLDELGNGLSEFVNANTCETCQGKGYKAWFNSVVWKDCKKCEGTGVHFYACRKCKGSGVYKNPRTNKDVGKCNLCGGSGRFYPKRTAKSSPHSFRSFFDAIPTKFVRLPNGKTIFVNSCKQCSGFGRVSIPDINEPTYNYCWDCDGKGEIKIYNPVIPKGLLLGVKE